MHFILTDLIFACLTNTLLNMQLSITTHDLTVSVDIPEDEEKDINPSPNDVMIAAYKAIEHVFSYKGMVRAYYETDPYYTCLREPDDPVLAMMPEDVQPCFGKKHR